MRSRYKARSVSNGVVDYAEVESSDRLATINVVNGTKEGEVLFSQNLNPRTFENTNLGTEATLWDRYRLKEIQFTFCPAVGTSKDGAIVAAFDPDIQDENSYAQGEIVGLTRFCAHETAAQTSVFRPQTWRYVAPKDLPFLYTRITNAGGNPADTRPDYWTSCGIFAILANNAFTSALALGTVWYDAVYEFSNRNLEGAVQDFTVAVVTNDGTSGSTTPFKNGTVAELANVQDGANLPLPERLTDGQLQWTGLDPGKTYLIESYYATGGSTCSASPTIAVNATYGTVVNSFASFSSTQARTTLQVRPNAAGVVRTTHTQGTWATYPTSNSQAISSLPTLVSIYA